MQVINDRVAVRLDEFAEVSPGGILIPQSAQEKPVWTATVVATGKGLPTLTGVVVPLTVTTGDRVIFHRGAGVVIEVKGEKFTVIKESDILAIL